MSDEKSDAVLVDSDGHAVRHPGCKTCDELDAVLGRSNEPAPLEWVMRDGVSHDVRIARAPYVAGDIVPPPNYNEPPNYTWQPISEPGPAAVFVEGVWIWFPNGSGAFFDPLSEDFLCSDEALEALIASAAPDELEEFLGAGHEPVACPPEHDGASAECLGCGVRDCPDGEPLHHHHDGCPACWTPEDRAEVDAIMRQSMDEPEE